MTDRPGDHIFLVVVVILTFFESAEGLGDIGGNRRLLGDYEGLGHGAAIELSRGVFASQSSLPAPSKAGKSLA